MQTYCVVVLSGGMDSATVLAKAVKEYGENNVLCVFFNYNQMTFSREHKCFDKLVDHYNVDSMDIFTDMMSSGLVVGNDTDYEVVGRNSIMALQAMNIGMNYFKGELALDESSRLLVCLGIQGSDNTDYIDCTVESVDNTTKLIEYLSKGKASLWVPYLQKSKVEIIKEGTELGVPYELTWSCYRYDMKPCGTCPSCVLRENAFKEAGIMDPIYAKEAN